MFSVMDSYVPCKCLYLVTMHHFDCVLGNWMSRINKGRYSGLVATTISCRGILSLSLEQSEFAH
jgi:hypothetical protein